MGRSNPLRDLDQMWHVGRYGGRNHVCNIWWLSVKGCGCGERGKFAFYHWLEVSPLQHWSHYRVTVWSACISSSRYQILSKSGDPLRSNDVRYNFKMAAAVAQYHLRFRIWWCNSHPKVKIYSQRKFRQHILIHSWDTTTSGLEKQTSAIFELFFPSLFWPDHSNLRAILHQITKCRPNRAIRGRVMT